MTTKLPPCPIEGCVSESDHHWHWDSSVRAVVGSDEDYCACDFPPLCYSRAHRPAQLTLGVETVAKMIEAAQQEAWDRATKEADEHLAYALASAQPSASSQQRQEEGS